MDASAEGVCRELLLLLAELPDEMAAIVDLPAHLLDADVLAVMDADRLIEFGTRRHCHVGGKNPELRIESGWDFRSITGPDHLPMAQIIDKALSYIGDEQIRQHVRLTNRGRVEAARHRCEAVSTAAIAAAMERHPTVLDTLVYLYHRQGEVRQTTTLEREARPRITHICGEPYAAAMEWVYKRSSWLGSRNGAELYDHVRHVANDGVGDPVVREIVVPRLEKLDTPSQLRALWRMLLRRFPYLDESLSDAPQSTVVAIRVASHAPNIAAGHR